MRKINLDNDLLNFAVEWYGIDETEKPLTCFTECLVQCDNGTYTTVRCHPNYQSKGPWNDWGMIRHGNKVVPAKFHFFVDNETETPDAIVELGDELDESECSVLTDSWSFPLMNDEERYHQINMKDYVRPCLVFQKKATEQILVVLPYEEWHTEF